MLAVGKEGGGESGANASLHLNINKHGVPSKMRQQMPRELLLLLLLLRDFHESSRERSLVPRPFLLG